MVRFSDIKEIRDKTGPRDTAEPKDGGAAGQLRLSDPQFSELSKQADLASEEPGAQRDSSDVAMLYEKLVRSAKDVQEKVEHNQVIAPSPILADLHAVIDRNLIQSLYEHAMSELGDWREISVHGVEVALASLMVGRGMGYDRKKLLELGIAAFLENVGMYRIPAGILEKPTGLDPEEIDLIREHPETSTKILSRLGERYEWLAEVAFQVHERADFIAMPLITNCFGVYVFCLAPECFRERGNST